MEKKIYKLHIFLFITALALAAVCAVCATAIWQNRSYFFDQHIYNNAVSYDRYTALVYAAITNPENTLTQAELRLFGDTYYYIVRTEDGKVFTDMPSTIDRSVLAAQDNIAVIDFYYSENGTYEFGGDINTTYYVSLDDQPSAFSGYIYVDKNGSGIFQRHFNDGFSIQNILYMDTAGFFISLMLALPLFFFSFQKALFSMEDWIDKVPDDIRLLFCAVNSIVVLALFELHSGRLYPIYFLRDRLIYGSLLIFFLFIFFLALSCIIYKLFEYRKKPFMMKDRWDMRFSRKLPLWLSLMIWAMPLWLFWWLAVYGFNFQEFYLRFQMPAYQGGISFFVFLFQFIVMLIVCLLTQFYYNARGKYGRAVLAAAKTIAEGDIEHAVPVYGSDTSAKTAEAINAIMEGYHLAIDEQKKSERLKYELVTNISHDLRTPLTSVTNYIELIKQKSGDGVLDNAVLEEYISHADINAKKLSVMIEDLFELSKMESGNMPLTITEIDINLLLRQVCHEHLPQAEAIGSEIVFIGETEPVFIFCDAAKISRLFDNLIVNAIKYALPSTRIFIEHINEQDNIKVIIRNIANYRLDFAPEELFLRFKRADEARTGDGSGLGLAIAKSITELHGSKINIEVEGDLFRVIVELPKSLLIKS